MSDLVKLEEYENLHTNLWNQITKQYLDNLEQSRLRMIECNPDKVFKSVIWMESFHFLVSLKRNQLRISYFVDFLLTKEQVLLANEGMFEVSEIKGTPSFELTYSEITLLLDQEGNFSPTLFQRLKDTLEELVNLFSPTFAFNPLILVDWKLGHEVLPTNEEFGSMMSTRHLQINPL